MQSKEKQCSLTWDLDRCILLRGQGGVLPMCRVIQILSASLLQRQVSCMLNAAHLSSLSQIHTESVLVDQKGTQQHSLRHLKHHLNGYCLLIKSKKKRSKLILNTKVPIPANPPSLEEKFSLKAKHQCHPQPVLGQVLSSLTCSDQAEAHQSHAQSPQRHCRLHGHDERPPAGLSACPGTAH